MRENHKDSLNYWGLKKTYFALWSEWSLFVLSVVVLMSKSWESTLQAMDSSIHARLALALTQNGMIPVLPMPHFNDHPYTLFYLVGHFMRVFGAEAWSARFLPSLFSVLSVMALYRLGSKFFSERVGFFSGIFLLITPLFIQFGARFQLDPAMLFFIILSFLAWMSKKPMLAGLACGLAVAMKSPVGFLLFPSVFISEVVLGREISVKKTVTLFFSFIIACIPPGFIWFSADLLSHQPLFLDYLQRQVLGTAVHGRGFTQDYRFFYFFTDVMNQNRIWKWILILALLGQLFWVKIWEPMTEHLRLMWVAVGVVVGVISMMKFKFPHYYLPVFPFLSVAVAASFDSFFLKLESALRKFVIGVSVLVPLMLLVFPIRLAPEMFPAFRKFAALIQSKGTQSDLVLFVDYMQPYGSYGDYGVEVAFYADRKFVSVGCKGAAMKLDELRPQWVITSGAKLEECIQGDQLKRFPLQIQLGNQYLLGVYALGFPLDLTPLYRELKAPVDGKPAELPQDLPYHY